MRKKLFGNFFSIYFASISFFLSRHALKAMQEAIIKLDNFSKDLIHDLNTPVTSILLQEETMIMHVNIINKRDI